MLVFCLAYCLAEKTAPELVSLKVDLLAARWAAKLANYLVAKLVWPMACWSADCWGLKARWLAACLENLLAVRSGDELVVLLAAWKAVPLGDLWDKSTISTPLHC